MTISKRALLAGVMFAGSMLGSGLASAATERALSSWQPQRHSLTTGAIKPIPTQKDGINAFVALGHDPEGGLASMQTAKPSK
ncbi:hypothetical protein [uncultured Cohaesibacter sp.]|uniref:hypothetical protein n=1 Tax=uncultured Cohaesibacter sp. TaxID=1002546 RepID=UPI002AA62C5D|nr:hypothetical protein [uncultured Cohaesibacter sp.]